MFDLSKASIRVIGKKVLLLRDPQNEDDGPIVIPEQFRKYTAFGTVLQMGSRVADVKQGDRVIFHKNYTYLPFEQRRVAITDAPTLIGVIEIENDVELVRPLGSYVVIEPESRKKMAGEIELPNEGEIVYGGIVMAAGPHCEEVEVGACVFYNHGLAIQCTCGQKTIHIITEEHILCQIK